MFLLQHCTQCALVKNTGFFCESNGQFSVLILLTSQPHLTQLINSSFPVHLTSVIPSFFLLHLLLPLLPIPSHLQDLLTRGSGGSNLNLFFFSSHFTSLVTVPKFYGFTRPTPSAQTLISPPNNSLLPSFLQPQRPLCCLW